MAFPDGRAQAGGGAPGARVSDCGSSSNAALRSTQALQRAEGVSLPAGAVDPDPAGAVDQDPRLRRGLPAWTLAID